MSQIFFRPQLFELIDDWKGKIQLTYLESEKHINASKMQAYEFLFSNYPNISIFIDNKTNCMIVGPTPNYTSVNIINN